MAITTNDIFWKSYPDSNLKHGILSIEDRVLDPRSMTEQKSKVGTAEGIIAFQSLDAVQRGALSKQLKVVVYKAGEFVVHHTGNERDVFFIVSGSIRVCMMSVCGKEVQFEDLESGEMFGEIAALDGKERTSNCVALTETKLAIMSQTDFLAALDTYNGFNRYIVKRLTYMLRTHMGRVFEFSTRNVKDRVRFEVFRIGMRAEGDPSQDIVIKDVPTHADIASRISSHREAVTRELKQLEKDGVITWKPGNYVIHKLNELTTPAPE